MKIAKHLCFPDGSYNGPYNGSYTVPTRFLRFPQKPTQLSLPPSPRPRPGAVQLRRALTQDILRMNEVQLGGRKVGRHALADASEKACAHVLEEGPMWLRTCNVFQTCRMDRRPRWHSHQRTHFPMSRYSDQETGDLFPHHKLLQLVQGRGEHVQMSHRAEAVRWVGVCAAPSHGGRGRGEGGKGRCVGFCRNRRNRLGTV